jgi:hypothetical protein
LSLSPRGGRNTLPMPVASAAPPAFDSVPSTTRAGTCRHYILQYEGVGRERERFAACHYSFSLNVFRRGAAALLASS